MDIGTERAHGAELFDWAPDHLRIYLFIFLNESLVAFVFWSHLFKQRVWKAWTCRNFKWHPSKWCMNYAYHNKACIHISLNWGVIRHWKIQNMGCVCKNMHFSPTPELFENCLHHFGSYYVKLRVEEKNWSPGKIQRVVSNQRPKCGNSCTMSLWGRSCCW